MGVLTTAMVIGNAVLVADADLAVFCRRNGIRRLALFGSVLRDDFRDDSDVDVLVDFVPGFRVGLIRLAGMEIELGRILGREVDLNTPRCLGPGFREEAVASARVLYEQA